MRALLCLCLLGVGLGCDSARAQEGTPSAPSARSASAPSGSVRAPTNWSADPDEGPKARQDGAARRRLASVKRLFADAEMPFPPGQLLLRGFKRDGALEVWAAKKRGAVMKRVATYGICAASGEVGPKRKEGDRQVPEGFYHLDFFHPQSRFHLSMRVSYPNRSDRILSDPKEPGGEIMIHGGCASVGCLAMSDERIEELWLMARRTPGPIAVHLYPARDLDTLLADESLADHHALWRDLAEGKRRFEEGHVLVRPRVTRDGRYRFP